MISSYGGPENVLVVCFTNELLKSFHVEEDDIYINFSHLKQTWNKKVLDTTPTLRGGG